jgi:hypothetical protein
MTHNKSPLATLASLLLKSHFELNELLAQSPSSVFGGPLNVGVRLGKTEGTMSVGQTAQGFTLSFSEDGRSYQLVLAPRASAAEPLKVRVTLIEGDKREEHAFDGAALFSAAMPEQFRALHARVLDFLKKMLPEALLAKLQAATDAPASGAAGKEASPGSQPVATESAAPTDAPAQADAFSWYHVRRDGQPDLRFRGKSLGCVHSAVRNGRQTALEVFVTPSGKYVGVKVGLSYWLGERDIATVQVAETLDALVPFFGFSPLAKALYERLAVATAEVLE